MLMKSYMRNGSCSREFLLRGLILGRRVHMEYQFFNFSQIIGPPLVGASGKKNFDAGGETGWKATVLN